MSSYSTYAVTLSEYNNFVSEGKLYNLPNDFDARFNSNALKYRKFGHFMYDGEILYPSGNPQKPFESSSERALAHQSTPTDKTYNVVGEFNYDEMDYSYYDIEGLSSVEYTTLEFVSKLEALEINDEKAMLPGYGMYNLREGKNLVSFINFAYDFYINESKEAKAGLETESAITEAGLTGKICPMEKLKKYKDIPYADSSGFENEEYAGFPDVFRDCQANWQYQAKGSNESASPREEINIPQGEVDEPIAIEPRTPEREEVEIEGKDSIFSNLQDYYMALVYLQPGLKKFRNYNRSDFDSMDENDNAAFLSMMYERFGGRPINSGGTTASYLTNRLGEIGTYDILGALIDDGLGFSVGERIYRYEIEVKNRNNAINLARWITEYEDIYETEYEPLDANDYDVFKKAYNEAYKKYGQDRAKDVAFDFGYVENPEVWSSEISFDKAVSNLANHIKNNFAESQFYANSDNANYVARSFVMIKKMLENDAFSDITDIYCSNVQLIEHSFGYNSCQVMLADTQVVTLAFPPDSSDDYDTDGDTLLDTRELGSLENFNITELINEYIRYNKITDEEEKAKLLSDCYIAMYNYSSNPVLPDTDFDGRSDSIDTYKLNNKYNGHMSTLNYDKVNFDYYQDYRYFFMPSDTYYHDLSEMSMILANMVNQKDGVGRKFNKTTIGENYSATGINEYMWYIGLDDIWETDMSNTYDDTNVCRYALGHRDVVYSLGKTQNVTRNVIAISIGDIAEKAATLYGNFDGHNGKEGDYTEYHHVGFDVVANRILESVLRYADQYDDRNRKVYWITGEGGGGSVANLLAKKLIDKYGSDRVYSYTFQALNTINANNLTDNQRIVNEKYRSIYNLYNDDDSTIKIYSKENKFYKYGKNIHASVINNGNLKGKWNETHEVSYPNTGSEKFSNIVEYFKEISNQLEDVRGLVYGFSGAMTSKEFFEIMFFGTPNDYLEKKEDCDSFYQSLEDVGTDEEYLAKIGIKNMKVHAKMLIDNMRSHLGIEPIKAIQDIGDMAEVLTGVKEENPAVISKTGETYKPTTGYDKEIVKIISSVAGYYINFVPTYSGKFKTSVSGGNVIPHENDLANKHLIENLSAYSNAVSKDNISFEDDNKIKLIKTIVDGKVVSTEREFNNISKDDNKPMYTTNSMGYYKWEEYINKEYDESKKKYVDKDASKQVNTEFEGREYTKDDCSGFVQLVNDIRLNKNIYGDNNLSTGDLINTEKKGYAKLLYDGNSEIEIGLHKGYICFEMKNGKWVAHRPDGSNEDIDEKDMGVSFLRPGDLLVAKATVSHAEYYVGDGYTVTYCKKYDDSGNELPISSNIEQKKLGIASITIPTTFTTPNIKAVGTFSWGSVKDEFPVESSGENGVKNYFYYNDTGHYFQHCECGKEPKPTPPEEHSPDCSMNSKSKEKYKEYTIIWRKQ